MIDNEQIQISPSPVTETTPVQEHEQPSPEPGITKEPTPQEMRFKTLRELKEKAERERDEALRQLQSQQQPKQQKSLNIGNDELAEGKHLQALQEEIERLRSEMSDYKQYSSTATAEARLKASYPDIDKVVSKENMEILAAQEPEIYASIMSTQDFYAKGVTAYKALKKFGIHIEDTYQQDRAVANKNANKPRPATSISPQQGDTPLSHANAFANGLTEELKAQLYREMIESRKSY